jgi:hypothetical protein
VAKVVPPSNQVLTELLDHLSHAPTTGASRDLPDLPLETLDGCLAEKQAKAAAAETETEKLPFPRPSDRALGFVDFKLQLARKESGKALQYPHPRVLATHIDVTVVGITGKSVSSPLQFPVQLIQE